MIAMHPVAATRALRKHLTLAAMSLGYGVVQLDITIVNVAIDSIGRSFGGGVAALQWVVTAYTTAFAALILTAGALGDRMGAKRVFATGFAIFTVASLACALAPSLGVLIAARAVRGVGAAVLVPNSLALLNHTYSDKEERGWAVAMWAAGASVALTAGPLIGGALIAISSWRSIFLVNVPLGLAAIWLTWRYTMETSASRQRHLDSAGQLTGIVALACLAGAIIEGGKLGWTNGFVLAAFFIAILSITAFVAIEWRAEQPMLPLSLFRRRAFSSTSAVGLLINIAFYGLLFVFSLYFREINGWSPLWTGMAFVPMVGAVLIANLVVPRISPVIGPPITVVAGSATMALACLALLGTGQGTPYVRLVGQFVVLGGGLGLLVPPLTSMLLASVERSRSGIASGVLNSMRQIGSVLGVALFGSMIGVHGLLPGMHISLVISVVLLAVSAAAMLFEIKSTHV
ncbi:MFS transporter [Mesorhizobium sp. WSM4884]|uniref:MFS transporter n=1 Tax=Mesorhizobium sp. WSM4884 TaxID=3038542 RepID=UPI0024172F69|nr:MFS transporter [Mesorhizobium sp. WSM4884]MDG4883978.1 MFS transporter [Mesorhizobium sp. WSM4884]